jgi:hypothetical protein
MNRRTAALLPRPTVVTMQLSAIDATVSPISAPEATVMGRSPWVPPNTTTGKPALTPSGLRRSPYQTSSGSTTTTRALRCKRRSTHVQAACVLPLPLMPTIACRSSRAASGIGCFVIWKHLLHRLRC